MATFVLVHGAWHGAWCWELVSETLEGMGHKVVARDLPGMGSDKTPLNEVSLVSWTDHICNLIEKQGEPVVLAGHSRGGVVISEVAERIPNLISRLAYVAAFLVPNGKTLADMVPLVEQREVAKNAIDMREDGISSTIASRRVGPIFYNTSSPALQARAASMLTPEPMMSFITPVSVTAERFGSVRRGYVECVKDNAIPIELQRLMRETLPCNPVITLDCDHSPFYSQPGKLADALVKIAQ